VYLSALSALAFLSYALVQCTRLKAILSGSIENKNRGVFSDRSLSRETSFLFFLPFSRKVYVTFNVIAVG
jgi:hypothetical protein